MALPQGAHSRATDGPKATSRVYRKLWSPIGDLVAIQAIPRDVSAGGIVLPDGAVGDQSPQARVVAVGPEVKWLKPEDVVFVPDGLMMIAVMYQNTRILVTPEKNITGFVDKVRAENDAFATARSAKV